MPRFFFMKGIGHYVNYSLKEGYFCILKLKICLK